MTKKFVICLTGLFIIVTCTACKTGPAYVYKDFLNTLAIRSGIGQSENIEDNLNDLSSWGVTVRRDVLDGSFDYEILSETISELIGEDDDLLSLKNKKIVDDKVKGKQTVFKEDGEQVIDRTVEYLNSRDFSPVFDYEYISEPKNEDEQLSAGDIVYTDGGYMKVAMEEDETILTPAEFEEVFSYLEIADSFYIDFEEVEVIPYGEPENSAYVNENFNLLASNNHVFSSEGFRISYTLNRTGIDVHISREVNGVNIYGDLSLNNVKPVFKWLYEEDDVKNCFFSLSFKTTEKLGASIGRYGNYHLRFKDVDSSSFKSLIGSIIEKDKDELEASIPICQIRTPIPNVPTAFLNLDLLIKLYVSGKVELVLYNSHNIGFETRNGNVRFINDTDRDLDAIIQASGKAALGLNVNLEAVKFRLADIELDGGVRALVKSTLHLYNEEGDVTSESSDYALSTLQELSDGNPDVKVCGDLSLYYLLDLIINTSKTQMAKFGFSKTYNIMDEDNQIFNNLSHIEDGHFVKSCTRNKRPTLVNMEEVKSTRIVLNSYAEVLKQDETFMIEVLGMPEGYTKEDLVYKSLDNSIATVEKGLIRPVSPGSTRIDIHTKDNKYSAYVNVLVSTQ
ncbi:MAG: hypothetical protein J6Z03_02270 [Erysipelotrichaceae bacterium]|nr:hypothetical protein [Erysipelotrichaceae bacterium]